MTRKLGSFLMVASLFGLAGPAGAAPITFFGEDLGAGDGTGLTVAFPNSLAAQADFLANLVDPGIEDFEGIVAGTGTPLNVVFDNGVTATLNGSGSVLSNPDGVANVVGRYGVTGDPDADERYWESGGGANAFTVVFDAPISAFGFFGIDIGDFNGQVTATTGGGLNQVFNVGNSTNIAGGSVLFWGVIDPVNSFTSVTFGNTGSGDDFFGFDDFTIGTPEQVRPPVIPEPSTLLLLGTGLLGAGWMARRRRTP